MQRILLYSDLQFHPYKEFSNLVNGVNDRLLDHIVVLNQIYDYAVQHSIDTIVFGGDMFEARAKVDVIAAKLLADWKHKVASAGIKQIDLVGNHDLYDKSTLHNSIDLYKYTQGQRIVSQPQWVSLGYSTGILFVPFMYRLEDIKEALNLKPPAGLDPQKCVAIVHYGLYDVPTESRFVIRDQGYDTEGQIRLADLENLLQNVRYAFFGHFHITTAVTPRVHFIGTPLQHKWGERTVDTRFLDIDLEQGTFKGIRTHAPRFIEWETADDIDTAVVKGNFCRVKVPDMESREQIRTLLAAHKPRGIDVSLARAKAEATSRLGLDLSMSFEEMGVRMVDADTETKLDRNRIKQVMFDALKQASRRTA